MAKLNLSVFDVFDSFDVMSVKELLRAKRRIDTLITDKTPSDRSFVKSLKINDFVSFEEDFLSAADHLNIANDLQVTNHFRDVTEGTASMWLSKTSQPYQWESVKSGKITKNSAIPIGRCVAIESLMVRLNEHLNADFNSCLVSYYPNGRSGIRIHDDFEHVLDNNHPIAVVTMGTERKVEFYDNYQLASEAPIKTVRAKNGSLYVMGSKCQEYFRHKVPAQKEITKLRFCLSFRRILVPSCSPPNVCMTPVIDNVASVTDTVVATKDTGVQVSIASHVPAVSATPAVSVMPAVVTKDVCTSPIKSQIAFFENFGHTNNSDIPQSNSVLQSNSVPVHYSDLPQPNRVDHYGTGEGYSSSTSTTIPTAQPRVAAPAPSPLPYHSRDERDITLIVGTSITQWVNCDVLSDRNTEVINVSHSGARIKNFRRFNRIPDAGMMLENFAVANTDKTHRVKQIIFSLGTNDIKFYRTDNGLNRRATPGDMNIFCRPIENLIQCARYFFGDYVRIYFQSVLPMKIMYTYTADNFLGFNEVLRKICDKSGCHFFDIFNSFIDSNGHDYNRNLFCDPYHLNRYGYGVLHDCLKYVVGADRHYNYNNSF